MSLDFWAAWFESKYNSVQFVGTKQFSRKWWWCTIHDQQSNSKDLGGKWLLGVESMSWVNVNALNIVSKLPLGMDTMENRDRKDIHWHLFISVPGNLNQSWWPVLHCQNVSEGFSGSETLVSVTPCGFGFALIFCEFVTSFQEKNPKNPRLYLFTSGWLLNAIALPPSNHLPVPGLSGHAQN